MSPIDNGYKVTIPIYNLFAKPTPTYYRIRSITSIHKNLESILGTLIFNTLKFIVYLYGVKNYLKKEYKTPFWFQKDVVIILAA